MADLVQLRREGSVVHVTLARPEKGNSLSSDMVVQLSASVTRCYEDGTALLILAAQGKNFCTGFDLSELQAETDDSLLARFIRIELLLQALNVAPFLSVALGGGLHLGAGADLYAACQRRVLTGDGRFRFPGAAFGLVLGGGRLSRIVGASTAGLWASSGCWVEKDEACARGLITHAAGDRDALLAAFMYESAHIDSETRRAIYAGLAGAGQPDRELAALVRSASLPGLKRRIEAYREHVLQQHRSGA